ncbi:carboxypeptidase, partial [Candidatus Pacearchaeota archaeon]|nr:carboxypeptidase [Candidatus Pacearchaeota archaeon]
GKTAKNRDMWVMELTNKKTGAAEDKPAMWIDGNLHAGEVTGREVALKTIIYLLTEYGKDHFITELLDTKCIFILPCVNPDGSEIWLTTPYHRTGAGIPNPAFEDEFAEGLYEEDINNDGFIVQMRVKDPNGDWKVSKKDPRLMIKRKPDEGGGLYYRIYGEGLIKNYDGKKVKIAPPRWLGCTNRNNPAFWAQTQKGQAGLFQLWEKEEYAIAQFFYDHKNIGAGMNYHTYSGILMRPYVYYQDEHFFKAGLSKDFALYKAIGEIGEELTGYSFGSPGEHMNQRKPEKKPYARGNTHDWWYEHWGMVSLGLELWDILGRAGLGNFRERGYLLAWTGDITEDHGLKLLAWNDKELEGKGFIKWTPFNHPQLGPVEIGGWKHKYTWQNPSPHLLESEIDNDMMWSLKVASLLPLVKITDVKVIPLGERLYRIEAIIENTGFMPTYITQQAINMTLAKPVKTKIELGEDVELVVGKERVIVGNLEGRTDRLAGYPTYGASRGKEEESKTTVEWTIRVKKTPAKVKIVSISEKGGKDTKEIEVK